MPPPTKHDAYHLPLQRLLTGRFRALPDYLILGAQKAGTTTIYDNLLKHPAVQPSSIKEVHFFDNNWHRGSHWYQAHFPVRSSAPAAGDARKITGEGSPYYLYHPHVPLRVKELIPTAKLIVVLRNPVDRAYSHYQHEVRKGRETLPFEKAVELEPERLAGEWEKIKKDPGYISFALQHFSYLTRGSYAEQLERWFKVFPRDQFLILSSDELNQEFATTFERLLVFLGLSPKELASPKRSNVGTYQKMSDKTRERLLELFQSQNQDLENLLGRKFGWDK